MLTRSCIFLNNQEAVVEWSRSLEETMRVVPERHSFGTWIPSGKQLEESKCGKDLPLFQLDIQLLLQMCI